MFISGKKLLTTITNSVAWSWEREIFETLKVGRHGQWKDGILYCKSIYQIVLRHGSGRTPEQRRREGMPVDWQSCQRRIGQPQRQSMWMRGVISEYAPDLLESLEGIDGFTIVNIMPESIMPCSRHILIPGDIVNLVTVGWCGKMCWNRCNDWQKWPKRKWYGLRGTRGCCGHFAAKRHDEYGKGNYSLVPPNFLEKYVDETGHGEQRKILPIGFQHLLWRIK